MKNIIFKIIVIILLAATTILSITNTIKINKKSNKLEENISNNIQLRDNTGDKIEKNIKTIDNLNKKIEEQEKSIIELQNTINKQQEEITNLQNQINGINSSNYQGQINILDNRLASIEDLNNYYKKLLNIYDLYQIKNCLKIYFNNRNAIPEYCPR